MTTANMPPQQWRQTDLFSENQNTKGETKKQKGKSMSLTKKLILPAQSSDRQDVDEDVESASNSNGWRQKDQSDTATLDPPEEYATPVVSPEDEDRDEYSVLLTSPDDIADEVIKRFSESRDLPPGMYDAVLYSIETQQTKAGLRLEAAFICAESAHLGHKQMLSFRLTESDGTPMKWGPVYATRFVQRLGYSPKRRIREVREEISRRQPAVQIKVSHNGEYTNVRLIKPRPETGEIQACREWIAEHMEVAA